MVVVCRERQMHGNTATVELTGRLRSFVDVRLRQGDDANESEYFCDLVRRDCEEQVARRLRELIWPSIFPSSSRF